MNNLHNIASKFLIEGTVSDIKPLGNGLINDTYRIQTAETDRHDYVLQRINHHIFTDVDMLQHNVETVTNHIREQLKAIANLVGSRDALNARAAETQAIVRAELARLDVTGAVQQAIASADLSVPAADAQRLADEVGKLLAAKLAG